MVPVAGWFFVLLKESPVMGAVWRVKKESRDLSSAKESVKV